MKQHIKDHIVQNHRRMEKSGELHRLPNGQRGTVLKCPYPGCRKDGVEGWSSCSSHFDEVREAFTTPPSPFSQFSLSELEEEVARRKAV